MSKDVLMTYTLYGFRRSGSCIVELTLAEIGVAYEVHNVSLSKDDQRKASYAAVNPQRKIPSLITKDGEMLTESVAIVLTLDERHPEAGLLPPMGSPMRAQALRRLLFVATEIYPLVEIIDYPTRFTSGDEDDVEAVRQTARDTWRTRLMLLENTIDVGPYFLGAQFCLTDLYIAVISRWARLDDWRPDNTPKIERLAAAVAARPACKAAWRNHFDWP